MNLDLGGTIWLNVSRKLLSYSKYFFKPFEELPEEVYKEFAKHKHTHKPITVKTSIDGHGHFGKTGEAIHSHTHTDWTGSTSSDSHRHSASTGSTACSTGYPSHSHTVYTDYQGAHSHTVQLAFSAASLGTPWYNHRHTITLVSMSSEGPSHNHNYVTPTSSNGCTYSDCPSAPHSHPVSTGYTTSVAFAHTHTIGTVYTGYADSSQAPQYHSHTFSFGVSSAGAHSHSPSTTITIGSASCAFGYSHSHSAPTSFLEIAHNHTISGTTALGGEPLAIADAGSGVDSLSVFTATFVSLSDEGLGGEAFSQSAQISLTDEGLSVEDLEATAYTNILDLGEGYDILVMAELTLLDEGYCSEEFATTVQVNLADEGTSIDEVISPKALTIIDSAEGEDHFEKEDLLTETVKKLFAQIVSFLPLAFLSTFFKIAMLGVKAIRKPKAIGKPRKK